MVMCGVALAPAAAWAGGVGWRVGGAGHASLAPACIDRYARECVFTHMQTCTHLCKKY